MFGLDSRQVSGIPILGQGFEDLPRVVESIARD